MRNLLSLIILFLTTTSSFAQNVDWVNAPINPISSKAHLKKQNLKGDVLQFDFNNFDKNGAWVSSNKSGTDEKVELDVLGRIIKEITFWGSVTNYTYDANGNLTKEHTPKYHIIYSYDNKNRLIKELYLTTDNKTRNSLYSYKTQNDILIINELRTPIGGKPIELEIHYKNGLKVYETVKNEYAIKLHYEIDPKGNWITQSTIDAVTNKLRFNPSKREIIYYDDIGKGFSVISSKKYENYNVIEPQTFLNNKRYHTAAYRFDNNFVFYDMLSKTYYVAREGYNTSNKQGQRLVVEKLLEGYETVFLFDGKKGGIFESGVATKVNDWTQEKYVTFVISTNSKLKKSFGFGPFPIKSDTKLIALGGKNMLDDVNKVSYLYSAEKKGLFVFEGGKNINVTFAGLREGDTSAIAAVDGVPKFVIPPSNKSLVNEISPARYFDPARDKILTKNATSTANPQTSVKASTTALPPANNSSGSSNSLSTDSRNYLSVYRNNPQGVKEHLAALYNVMLQKKYPPTMISALFAIMAKEVFPTNEDAAFELLMKMPNGVVVSDVLSNLPKEMRAVIGKRAKVATYAN